MKSIKINLNAVKDVEGSRIPAGQVAHAQGVLLMALMGAITPVFKEILEILPDMISKAIDSIADDFHTELKNIVKSG